MPTHPKKTIQEGKERLGTVNQWCTFFKLVPYGNAQVSFSLIQVIFKCEMWGSFHFTFYFLILFFQTLLTFWICRELRLLRLWNFLTDSNTFVAGKKYLFYVKNLQLAYYWSWDTAHISHGQQYRVQVYFFVAKAKQITKVMVALCSSLAHIFAKTCGTICKCFAKKVFCENSLKFHFIKMFSLVPLVPLLTSFAFL